MGSERRPPARLAQLLGPVAGTAPQATLFWSGAGISADAPTRGPMGRELTERALGHAFVEGTVAKLASYYRALRIEPDFPRLETVLEVVETVHGEAVLNDLLSDLEAPPNPLHRFFAWHLGEGGRHVTMNFDTCIERAGTGAWPGGPLLHVHGQLGNDGLGATLARIERGLDSEIRTRLCEVFLSPPVESIVFVGYSGSDFFDVDPFLAALPAGSLTGRKVLWLVHDDRFEEVEPTRPQLEALQAAGAQVREVKTPTRPALEEIGKRWEVGFEPMDGETPTWRPAIAIEPELRRRATVELYALMGLHKEVSALVEPADAHDWELLAHSRWAEGRYEEAGRSWVRSRAGASPAARAERVGAVAWIRGEYVRARDTLVAALEAGDGSFEERLLLAETLARVYVHMRRSPDSLRLATPPLRSFILAHLPDPARLAEEGRPLGTHLRNRLVSARAGLGVSAPEDAGAEQSFREYEALNAELNYRQGSLRARAAHEPVPAEDFYALRCGFETIGATGDAARAMLLAGVPTFSPRELRAATRRLQITRRQRNRLLAASLVGSFLRHIRMLLRRFKHHTGHFLLDNHS